MSAPRYPRTGTPAEYRAHYAETLAHWWPRRRNRAARWVIRDCVSALRALRGIA